MTTAVPAAYDKSLARWYPLIATETQTALVNDAYRFKICAAGRRSGKTERAKRFVTRAAMQKVGSYFYAAPTRDQAKRVAWVDLKLLSFSSVFAKSPSESELVIPFPNGSTLSVIGLDQPQRLEGSFWSGGIIDELAEIKPDAWQVNIAPALDTYNPSDPTYKAWAWLIGVPEGRGTSFYDLAEYARTANDDQWKFYHWPSSDILSADVVAAAKRRMSLKQFRTEYEASWETSSGRIYDDYNEDNETQESIQPHEQLLWMHDFNFTPLSSAIGVVRDDQILLLEEIVLTSAVARQSALEFVDRYKEHKNRHVVVYGDPSGRAGEKHGQLSDYTEIEGVLRDNSWTYTRKVRPSTASIKDGQNAVRAKIANAAGERFLFVNPNTAPYCHKSLNSGQLKQGSTFLEEDSEWQHIGTAIRYFVSYEFPIPGRENRQIVMKGGL